jgi:hypothetical protein
MALPLKPAIKPQLALSRKVLPEGEDWVYEPKYDGFRAIAYVDGDDVYLQSRGGAGRRRVRPVPDPLDGALVAQRRLRRARPVAAETFAAAASAGLDGSSISAGSFRRTSAASPHLASRVEVERLAQAAPAR